MRVVLPFKLVGQKLVKGRDFPKSVADGSKDSVVIRVDGIPDGCVATGYFKLSWESNTIYDLTFNGDELVVDEYIVTLPAYATNQYIDYKFSFSVAICEGGVERLTTNPVEIVLEKSNYSKNPTNTPEVPQSQYDALVQMTAEAQGAVAEYANELNDARIDFNRQKRDSVGDNIRSGQNMANAAGTLAAGVRDRIDNSIVPRLETLEQGGLQIKDEYIAEQINDWLDEHPEATTTVQDKSLTEDKFSDELRLTAINNYVTPQMYGAVGDGVTDDTAAFRSAIQHGKVYVPAGTYKITSLTLDKTCHISGASKKTTNIKTDGITITASSCLLEHLTLTANTSWTGSGIKFLAGGATCRDMQVYNFDICLDLRALENHIVTTCLTNVTVTGRFAGFAIGDPASTNQTNGVYLKRCYAVGCGGVGTDANGVSTDGYGYGYYVFGGYSVSIEDCIAEYCSGSGMYISASAQRPLNGLNVTNAYFENNKIAQIYVAQSGQLANVYVAKDVFISDSAVKNRADYKRAIYVENPAWFRRVSWNRIGSYGNLDVAGFSFGSLSEEAKRVHDSIMPISLDYMGIFSDRVGDVGLSALIVKDSEGDYVMSSTKANAGVSSLFSFEAKANQVYEITFKYRRVNNDNTVVKPIMTMHNGAGSVGLLATNIPYSATYTEVKKYISFPNDMIASFGYYFDGSTGATAEVHYKDFCIKPVSYARTIVGVLQGYPQDGFILYDVADGKRKIYDAPTKTWVDL